MPTVLLVRHGRTTANAGGLLAGRSAVDLDELGAGQAAATGRRLAALPLARVVTSPLPRCRRTAEAIVAQQPAERETRLLEDEALTECDYGEWQGRALADLAREDLWRVVQEQPSAVTFPGGESMLAMQARAIEAVRRHDAEVAAEHGPAAVWAAVSHGDLLKAVLADALGMHLDLFQRLDVHPASVSVVRYGGARPQVLAVNTTEGDLTWLAAPPPSDTPVGGGAGPEVAT